MEQKQQTSTNGSLPPHDISAEECVIGSLLISGDQMVNVGRLMPSDFYHEPLGILFTACKSLWNRKSSINQITVAQELDRQGKLETCEGVAYLSHLISIVPSPLDIGDYAQIVERLSVSRKAIMLGSKITDIGFSAFPSQQTIVEMIVTLVSEFRKNNGRFAGLITPRDASDMMFDLITKYRNKTEGISWGFEDLDRITSGIHPAELIVNGARPGVGKTQFMIDVADNVERQGKHILFVSAEMSMEYLLERKVSRLLQKGIREIRHGEITEMDERIIFEAASAMSQSNIYTLAANVSSNEIYAEASRLADQVGLDIILVDYLQKLADCYGDKENQNIRVGRACKVLKDIAIDLNIPVIVASQLSRAIEHRPEDEKIPNLADLRDSGSIEQDADVVFLLHRYMGSAPVYDGGNRDPRVLRIKMAKNRQLGAAQAQKLLWDNDEHRYVDYQP